MSTAAGPSDAQALAWLDALLDQAADARAASLAQLAAAQPALHARVCHLLALADRSGASWSMAGLGRWLDDTGLVAGTTLGAYRIVERIGRGGMAEVWRAERCDGVPMPPLAVKLPLFCLDSPVDRERFARERDVLATLSPSAHRPAV